jgi:hypothetical protein
MLLDPRSLPLSSVCLWHLVECSLGTLPVHYFTWTLLTPLTFSYDTGTIGGKQHYPMYVLAQLTYRRHPCHAILAQALLYWIRRPNGWPSKCHCRSAIRNRVNLICRHLLWRLAISTSRRYTRPSLGYDFQHRRLHVRCDITNRIDCDPYVRCWAFLRRSRCWSAIGHHPALSE